MRFVLKLMAANNYALKPFARHLLSVAIAGAPALTIAEAKMMSVVNLKVELKKFGLSVRGKKKDLFGRLKMSLQQMPH